MKKKLHKTKKYFALYKVALYGSEGATNNCDCNLRVGC